MLFSEFRKFFYDAKALLSGSKNQKKPPYKLSWILYRLCSYEFVVVLFFRITSQLYINKYLRPLSLALYQINKIVLKVDIHPEASIGSGFQLVHGFSVVVGARAVLGCNVTLFDGVSIGKKNVGSNTGMPVVGSYVTVGSGAKVLGEIKIADGVTIGANSVVIHDFLVEGDTAVGAPAIIVFNKRD